jgi:hypothetical protein
MNSYQMAQLLEKLKAERFLQAAPLPPAKINAQPARSVGGPQERKAA